MAQTTVINFKVKNQQNDLINNATVCNWVYSSSNDFLQKGSGVTSVHGSDIYFEAQGFADDAAKVKVHVFFEGRYNIDLDFINFTINSTANTITRILNGSGGYYFNIQKYANYDSLFHFIGEDINVFPIKLNIKNENNDEIVSMSLSNNGDFNNYTGHCDTRYLILETISTGATFSTYDSSIKKIDIFGYLGGIINSVTTLTPRKIYRFECPFIYDTAYFENFPQQQHHVQIPVYNLPNVDMPINWKTWNNNCYYNNYSANSNTNIIEINNSDVFNSDFNNNDWFYRCLAGNDISDGNAVHYTLKKHHYNDLRMPLTLSSTTLYQSYQLSGDTINFLYICCNDSSSSPIEIFPNKQRAITLEREKDAVFRREDLVDYVKGFGYQSNGRINFSGFTLSPLEKCPPSTSGYLGFYNEATISLLESGESINLQSFKNNFVSKLKTNSDEVYTNYVLNNSLETHYSDGNQHCYVMDESFIPVSGEGKTYLYFTNRCTNPSILGYENINRTVAVSLNAIEKPSEIQIEYSLNMNPWKTYTIGEKIYLSPTSTVYFRAKTNNNTFSTDDLNFYNFDINNELINEECEISYNMLINSIGTTANTGYDVIVGGYISSLLSPNPSSSCTLNSYGFFDLFGNIKLTDASELNLDLDTVPQHGYDYMFHDTLYLVKGPKISARSINEYSMCSMFENSSVSSIVGNKLYVENLASHCFYKMFFNSNFNHCLIITGVTNASFTAVFKEMFKNCKGNSSYLNIENITSFGTSACTEMFYNSNTNYFSKFSNEINSIGIYSFYEAYRYSHLNGYYGDIVFCVTGSSEEKSCMFMFSDITGSISIDNLKLDSTNLGISCYDHMFYNSTGVSGTFYFNKPSLIPTSGCCYMFYNTDEIVCNILPATGLSNYCYAWMFCKSKIKVAPELSATTLYEECYRSMFQESDITHHYNHQIHQTGLDFNIGSEDIQDKNEYVLVSTVLPKKCYAYMYSQSKLSAVSNIITSGLTEAGEESCSHMFESTPIKIENRKRWLHDKSRNIDLNFRWFGMESIFVDGSYNSNDWNIIEGDYFFHLYKDYYFDGNNSEIKVLTGMTIGGIAGNLYTVKASPDDCNTIQKDGYIDIVNGKECFKLLVGITGNNKEFIVEYGPSETNPENSTATADRRYTLTIGHYPVYSFNESTALTNSNYEFKSKSEYVYLNATSLGPKCYEYMFSNCLNLIPGHNFKFGINSNSIITASTQSLSHMFDNCWQIRSISNDINKIIIAPYCFENMYSNCYSSVNYNFGIFDEKYKYEGLDYICSNIYTKYLGNDCEKGLNGRGGMLHSYCTNDYNTNTHHFNKNGIYVLGNNMNALIYDKTLDEGCFKNMFYNCRALRYGKINLNATNLKNSCYKGMFNDCYSLISGITITTSATISNTQCCHSMFQNCIEYIGPINDIHTLSPMTLSSHCYASMFKGCGSLSAGPYLPATSFTTGVTEYSNSGTLQCYGEMFNSAAKFEIDIEIKTSLTIKRKDNGNENDFTFYFGISGDSTSANSFWYFKNQPLNNGINTHPFYDDINFTVHSNFLLDIHGYINSCWYAPDHFYAYTNYETLISDFCTQFQNFLNEKDRYVNIPDSPLRTGRIISHGISENDTSSSGSYKKTKKNIKVIKSKISKNNLLSQSYTYYWLAGLTGNGATNGDYYGPACGITNTNGSTIPDNWRQHTS